MQVIEDGAIAWEMQRRERRVVVKREKNERVEQSLDSPFFFLSSLSLSSSFSPSFNAKTQPHTFFLLSPVIKPHLSFAEIPSSAILMNFAKSSSHSDLLDFEALVSHSSWPALPPSSVHSVIRIFPLQKPPKPTLYQPPSDHLGPPGGGHDGPQALGSLRLEKEAQDSRNRYQILHLSLSLSRRGRGVLHREGFPARGAEFYSPIQSSVSST